MSISPRGIQIIVAQRCGLQKLDGCIISDNKSHIPHKELERLLELISAHYFVICDKWKKHFNIKEIKFYC